MNNTTIFAIKSKINSEEAKKLLSDKEQSDFMTYRHKTHPNAYDELNHTIEIK